MKRCIYRKVLVFLCVLLPVWLACVPPSVADSAEQEKTVRVGWYPSPGLQDGDSTEPLGGFNYEYLMRIAQYTNWNYTFVFGDFGELEAQLEAGSIDILGDIAKTKARLSRYAYCIYPSCYSHTLLLCRNDDGRFAYDDYASYDGMVVGNSGSAFRQEMMDREAAAHGFHIDYRDYPTDDAMLEALEHGEVDMALVSDAIQNKSYKILHAWEPAAQYFVVNRNRPDLLAELNEGMESLQSADSAIQAHLFEKYFGGDNNAFSLAQSRDEMAAIAASPVLQVLIAEDQKPLSYVEDDQVKGFIPDYLKVLSQKTGLQFSYVVCKDYAEMTQRFAAGEGDLCGQLYENYAARNYKIIQPYTTLSCGLIYNPETIRVMRTVAVERGSTVLIQRLEEMGMEAQLYDSPQACLDAVKDKAVDAAAMPNIVFEQIAYHEPYLHLIYKAQSNLNLNLCLGVAAKQPLLFGIFSKATGAIAPSLVTHLLLADSSLQPEYTWEDYLQHNMLFINIIIVLLVVIVFLILWHRRQNHFNVCLLKATEAKNEFFNNLSHDLRTPLTGILGYSELAVRTAEPAKQQDYLQKIQKSGTLLLNLINDTLSLARIERGEFVLTPSVIHAKTFFEMLLVPLQSKMQQKDQVFSYELAIPADEYIAVDKLKFQDMLLNILSNAVKYTPAGGHISLCVQRLSAAGSAPQYSIEVRDTGIGMRPEFLTHLFEPFMQEPDKRAEGMARTGLGLAIVKRIVDLMQGEITVHSVKNEGTQVRIVVPVTVVQREAVAETVSQPHGRDAAVLQGSRILLCEDNMLNREIIIELLKAKGMRVDTAENGQKGLELFSKEPPGTYQAILMDIRMPVMDGYTATACIRALENAYAKTIPILALSADAYEESIRQSLACRMTAHLAKPIEPDQLFAALVKYIVSAG